MPILYRRCICLARRPQWMASERALSVTVCDVSLTRRQATSVSERKAGRPASLSVVSWPVVSFCLAGPIDQADPPIAGVAHNKWPELQTINNVMSERERKQKHARAIVRACYATTLTNNATTDIGLLKLALLCGCCCCCCCCAIISPLLISFGCPSHSPQQTHH